MTAVQFVGGRHDGERIEAPPAEPFPERLLSIDFRDGARYARTGGEDAMVFAFDPDGSLTRRARVTFGRLPEEPD